jgi:hypothetical protein
MDYGAPEGARAYIVGEGITNMILRQANITLGGTVTCFREEECKDMVVTLEEKGVADIPNRWKKTTILRSDGTYQFTEVPKMALIVKVETRGICWGR